MGETQIHTTFSSEKEIVDSILTYTKEPSPFEVRLYAVEVFKTLGFRAPKWIHHLISIFLSFASITNADILSMKQVAIYGLASQEQANLKASKLLLEQVHSLNF